MSANAYATLVAATATSTTPNTVDFNGTVKVVAWQIVANGTISAGAVTLQVSADGTTWHTIPSTALTSLSAATAANPYTLVTATNALFTATNVGVRYARATVSTTVTGGGSVTVLVSGI